MAVRQHKMNIQKSKDKNPDLYFEEDIRRLYDNSINDSFSNEYDAIYVFADVIQITLNESLGSPFAIGTQFLIKFENSFAIGEIYRIQDNKDGDELIRIMYLRLIKRETSYPEWTGNIEVLKVKISLIHYNATVYKKILSCFRNQQLKKALTEARKRNGGFQAFRTLISGFKGSNVSWDICAEDDSTERLQRAITSAYEERQTFIICSPSSDRLYEFTLFCNEISKQTLPFEVSKQAIVFPPGMFCDEKWKSDSLSNIKVQYTEYNMAENWDIERIEHELKFRGQDAVDLMKDVHPRIILGTPASLILVMHGLESHYCTFRDRLPKRIICDQGERILDVFALLILSSFPTIEHVEIHHQKEGVPVKYGENIRPLAATVKH